MTAGPTRLAVLLSGAGRTLQNLLETIARGDLDAEIRCVIADRDAPGVERARRAGIPAYVERDAGAIYALLVRHEVQLVCLAGYLRLFPIRKEFAGAVLNIHPALLPKFGGRGFYGERVHAAVLAAGERESGCTVHLCDEVYDHGRVLVQKRVPVLPGDDVRSLAARVFAAECAAYPEAIRLWARQHGTKP